MFLGGMRKPSNTGFLLAARARRLACRARISHLEPQRKPESFDRSRT